jgi:hypothetical protein
MEGRPVVENGVSSRRKGIEKGKTRLLELELDRTRVHGRNEVCHLVADTESVVLRLATEVDEEGIGVAVLDLGSPFLLLLDDLLRLRGGSGQ